MAWNNPIGRDGSINFFPALNGQVYGNLFHVNKIMLFRSGTAALRKGDHPGCG